MQVHLTRIDLLVVGGLSAQVAALCDDYERRLTRYVRLRVHELKAEPTARGQAVVFRAEGARMVEALDRIERQSSDATTTLALDAGGAQPTTEQLAEQLLSAAHLCVLIGGTMGLAPEARARARSSIAFGRISLPHQLARLVFTEQLYRSYRIARGEPYHF